MGRSSLLLEQKQSMDKRCAGLAALLQLLVAIGIGNPYTTFGGVIDPKINVTRVDSVKFTPPDTTSLTPGWGSHVPYDTFPFPDVTTWPASIILHGTAGPFPFHTTIEHPKYDSWYRLGLGVMAPEVKFGLYAGVEELKPVVAPMPRLSVGPSVVTGQMTVRLQPVGTARPVVEIHDAAGNVVRSLGCTAGAGGAATATWNREDDRGRLVPEGVYFCRYAAAGVIAVRKILVAH